jgi:hypothetical protein
MKIHCCPEKKGFISHITFIPYSQTHNKNENENLEQANDLEFDSKLLGTTII